MHGSVPQVEVVVNNACKATQMLNELLKRKNPETFNSEWIKKHSGNIYANLSKNFQGEAGGIDWDMVTVNLERTFQKRWKRHEKRLIINPYGNPEELNTILSRYRNKLYTLIAPLGKEEERIQDQIMICLVRLAQKGNTLAKDKVIEFMTIIIYDWIENHKLIARWKGYTYNIENRLQACIRNYRYSGSFINYAFKTFQFSARGLRPTISLDTRIRNSTKSRIDYVAQEDGLCA